MGFHRDMRGLSLHAPSNEKVENNSGSSIPKLKVVSLDGYGTLYPQIILANPNNKINFGITNSEILDGTDGTVATVGFMLNVDTSPWLPDTSLYSDASGNLSTVPLGNPVAIVIKQDATCGVLYATMIGSSFVEPQNPWLINGNNGTNPNTNFLGTLDNTGLSIRTNNTQRVRIDENGNLMLGQEEPQGFFHIKEHTSSPGTGRITHTFEVTTNDATYNVAYAYTVPNNAVVKVRGHILGRECDTSRCSFERVNTYTRDGGLAIRTGIGQSSYTYRSHSGYNFRWGQTGNQLTLEVKANTANTTKWIGTLEIDVLIA